MTDIIKLRLGCVSGAGLILLVCCHHELIDGTVRNLMRNCFELFRLAVVVRVLGSVHAICLADENAGSRLKTAALVTV